ncbi:MAG: hypothetical protein HFE66_01570 [Clostridiales bacterium]|jgi:5-bromo-4-chloroindolyl phosphate hydrolysis protein|nr:hypothetical protein [Clostridiales bacterium]
MNAPETNETKRICVKKKSALPLWVCTAVWILAGLFYPMYRLVDIAIVAVISLAAWLIAWLAAPEYTQYIEAPRPTSGNQDVDALCMQLESDASHIRSVAELLPSAKDSIAPRLRSIGFTLDKIAKNLQEDPSDLRDCRRLANYYLPVMQKLCDKYVFLIRQSTEDTDAAKNRTELKAKIEDAFAGIDSALKKQLDALYQNDSLDISTDIDVLKQMLRQDGLSE